MHTPRRGRRLAASTHQTAPSNTLPKPWTLLEAAAWFLLIVPVSFGLMGVGQIASSLFVALGKPIPPTLLSVLRTIVIYIPMAILFDQWWGYVGVFIAISVANLLFGVVAYLWGRRMLLHEVDRVLRV